MTAGGRVALLLQRRQAVRSANGTRPSAAPAMRAYMRQEPGTHAQALPLYCQ